MDLEALNNGWEIVNLEELAGAPSSGSGNAQIWFESDGLHFQDDSNERILTYAGGDTLTDLTISDADTPTLTITDTTTPVTVTLSANDSVATLQTTTAHSLVLGTNSTAAITINSSQAVTLAGNLTLSAGTITQSLTRTVTSGTLSTLSTTTIFAPSGASTVAGYGINIALGTSGSADMSGAGVTGFGVSVSHSNTNTLGSLFGLSLGATALSSGNITNAVGGFFSIANVSTGTIATARGQWIGSAVNSGGGAITTNIALDIANQTAGATNYAIRTGTGLILFGDDVEIDGDLNHDGSAVGFYGTAPVAKPTVTGSKGGNAALTSLMTALANLGIVTNSTS